MYKECEYCPQWNDYKGECIAPFWYPTKDRINKDNEESTEIEED